MALRSTNTLAFVTYLVAVSVMLAFCYARPSYNWDMLAYAAVVLDDGEISPEALHAEVYRIASEEVPEEDYRMLVDTTHQLRRGVLRNPERFHQFLSYFRVKPLYTEMCNAFYTLGVPLMKATVLPSIIGIFALALLLFYRFSRTFPFWAAAILGLSLICVPPVIEAASLSTPDALGTAVLVGAFMAYLHRAHVYLFMLLIAIAVLVRLDHVIPGTVLLMALLVRDQKRKGSKTVALSVVVLMALLIAYSWLILRQAEYNNGFEMFYGGLIRKWNPVLLATDAFQGLRTLQTSYVAIAGISFVALFYRQGFRFTSLNDSQSLFVAATIAFAARYILFPDLTTRLFLSYYILCWIFIIEGILATARPMVTEGSDNR
jgi:4-amino-4-deoxy-L-arabinose transferase-like glycosyltransferase